MDVFSLFLLILSLFLVLLGVKALLPKRLQSGFCVLCSAVSLSWITLLLLLWLGRFENRVLLALLMGTSVTGIFYLADAKLERLRFFRLPFFLTLLLLAYALVSEIVDGKVVMLIAGLWVLFLTIFAYRNNKSIKNVVDRIVACCKRW